MLNSFAIFEELSGTFDEKTAKVLTRTLTRLHDEMQQSVNRSDFDDLKAVVAELAEAQKRTEIKVEQLAEATRNTQGDLADLKRVVAELAEAQKRTEIKVEELAEAQKRTEARVEELMEAQKQTEIQIKELVQAQKRTEIRVDELAGHIGRIRKELGGLSHAVGYGIEDRLMPFMKDFARNQYGFEATAVKRCIVTYADGREDEVNLLISGSRNGSPAYLVGECKSKPGRRDLKAFDQVLKRLAGHFRCQVTGFMVGYLLSSAFAKAHAEKFSHIDAFQTYEVETIARPGS